MVGDHDLTPDEEAALMAALEESAAMHQATISSELCSNSFTEGELKQVPILNQFHPNWNPLISKYETASAICGYTACAAARVVVEGGDPGGCTTKEVQKALSDKDTINPKVEDCMRFVAASRRGYIETHKGEFREAKDKGGKATFVGHYMKAWVANYEVSDYLRSLPQDVKSRIIFVRFNQFPDLKDASHEERQRLLDYEACFDGVELLVETFPPSSPTDPPRLVAAEKVEACSEWQVAVVDLSGHFAVVVRSKEGCALYNTTDASYLKGSGGKATALAYKLLNAPR